jgi:hypothetical protein
MWHTWETGQVHSFGGADLKGKNHFEDLRVDGRIMLK